MSQQYHGADMDRPMPIPGSVRRARERAQAGLPRDVPQQTGQGYPRGGSGAPASRSPPTAPPRLAQRPPLQPEAPMPIKTSRQISNPQWPLSGPPDPVDLKSAHSAQPDPPIAPQPIRIPPTFNPSQLQAPNPPFFPRSSFPESPLDSIDGFDVVSPVETSSRRTTSSVGTIPDFPIPALISAPPAPRRSTILGPPPSSRRGLSTMYSNASLVSPILEETRSRGSYASSAAMPEIWGTSSSPMASPSDSAAFFDDSASERSRVSTLEDFGFEDEAQLIQSEDKDEKEKSTVTTTSVSEKVNPFDETTRNVDPSMANLTAFPVAKPAPVANVSGASQSGELTPDAILRAYAAASLSDPSGAQAGAASSTSMPYLPSGFRRPSFLDMSAVRTAEGRGSLTSLPDMIRRATRLASMIDKGKRPASRFDDLNAWDHRTTTESRDGNSSLSDMLAAFPPPAHSPPNNARDRGSLTQSGSWAMQSTERLQSRSRSSSIQERQGEKKPRRRCCGLPTWAVILIALVALALVAVAIVLPLEFFVFKNLGNRGDPDQSIDKCRSVLTCLNGGTNVIAPGLCSCVCSNGFTGSDCATADSEGCTSTTLVAADGSNRISNVTLGQAVPRLIASSEGNFSVPLSGTTILGRLNAGNLSCDAQNSLVNFQGRSSRASQPNSALAGDGLESSVLLSEKGNKHEEYYPLVPTIIIIAPIPRRPTATEGPTRTTYSPEATETIYPVPAAPPRPRPETTTRAIPTTSTTPAATSTIQTTRASRTTAPIGSTPTPSDPALGPANSFVVTEDVLDFARIAVLFVTQEQSLEAAQTAQTELRRFFSRIDAQQAGQQEAKTLPIGGQNRIDLVDFSVDLGQGPVGRKNFKRAIDKSTR